MKQMFIVMFIPHNVKAVKVNLYSKTVRLSGKLQDW